jgi:hypothetical protein
LLIALSLLSKEEFCGVLRPAGEVSSLAGLFAPRATPGQPTPRKKWSFAVAQQKQPAGPGGSAGCVSVASLSTYTGLASPQRGESDDDELKGVVFIVHVESSSLARQTRVGGRRFACALGESVHRVSVVGGE